MPGVAMPVHASRFHATGRTYRGYHLGSDDVPDVAIDADTVAGLTGYPEDAPPVFVGHYWLTGTPKPLAPNVACTDYCVAKGGKLVAYRWDGESVLNADNLRWVEDEMMVCMRPCRRTGGQDDGGKTMGRRDD